MYQEQLIIIRVGPDIRQFPISGQIPDIETIRIPDIRLIYNAKYPVIRLNVYVNLPDIERYPDSRPDIGYSALEISRISGFRPTKYPAQP